MSEFNIHTLESAPSSSREQLEASKKRNGFLPNLHAVMAESPQLLEAYKTLHGLFQQSSFTPEERTVVWQSINVEHDCHYCVPAHTVIASMEGVDSSITEALRNESPLPDPKLEALRTFTLAVVRQRGALAPGQLEAFLDAGFTKRNALDVLLGLSQKTLSNYTNHFAETPLDAPFKPHAWTRA